MRNYAHILVLMLRLRQMCCHRELVKEIDWLATLNDKSKLAKELGDLAEAEANLGGVNPDDPNDPEMAKVLALKLSQMIRFTHLFFMTYNIEGRVHILYYMLSLPKDS